MLPCYCKAYFPVRFVLAIMASLGLANMFALRVNLSVAIVHMKKELGWNSETSGIVLSSFYYGYIFTQLPAGVLVGRFSPKLVFVSGVLISTILTFLTPAASYRSEWLLVAVRAILGLAQGATYPALFALWSEWAPPLERSKLTAATLTGSYLGAVLSQPISGLLCNHGFKSGPHESRWPSVFYVFGMTSFVWSIAWLFLVHSSPKVHPRISPEEKYYIETTINSERKQRADEQKRPIPLGPMMRSPAVWATVIAYIGNDWIFFTFLTYVPTFLSDVLEYDITKANLLSKKFLKLMGLIFVGWSFFSTSVRADSGSYPFFWVDGRHATKKANFINNKH
eukprot:m.266375 g.266375  ORF g.266375 m.266375 type:complete len:338 (+) comp40500_c0_seq13:96-1109(+)